MVEAEKTMASPIHSSSSIRDVIVVVALVACIRSSCFLGCLGAYLCSPPIRNSIVRVLIDGWAAMSITYASLGPFNKGNQINQ
ncbi:conserved hypothetical protein [Ricinus communis]|uniref:Uncharacterized protein n=1 Tax=Ricinus communis TaxID=3988 RepID=B9S8M6_RICCO|nr:conserved hypothetical protein [Ricinus communis]